ncbi:glucuronate isomerase [Actinotalea sp. M2MS4P-6]|uniref:glucuronate isomerase n=1 Tax=Actinotalea sp. M2MS4P-6 TaxID=2983762 RepID=UPI0021E3F275|nr:glucuronate isomerase [Actinotalea sp. M2MS4P-6]MCV2394429.1 glucuronate isomerase [Actinotalea sp. M2MS4P-6]
MRRWELHPDRALPVEGQVRDIARAILDATAALPIVSMHGHVEAEMLDRDGAFDDPARLLVVPDHYVVRMLVSQGVPHDSLGVPRRDGRPVQTDPREIWRTFASNWHLFRGTPSRFWLEHVLVEVFGVEERLSAETADAAYDAIAARLATPEYRPLALLDRFGIELIATTDSAEADLRHHASLAARGWGERVVPTFRPDGLVHVDRPTWRDEVALLGERSGIEVTSYASFVAALEQRRAAFVAAGARATDHGHVTADTTPLEPAQAEEILAAALRGRATPAQAAAFSGHMLLEMARMSCEDGLVMQLHSGVLRDHDPAVHAARGNDVGYDIPVAAEYTRALRPLLERYGHHPRLTLVLFTVDEDVYSRELAPLAGVYPAVRLGAPWWFLDTPEAMRRFREAATDTAGFYNMTGFVDDTRAFFSIPARHNLARRIDAGHLARLVAEHRLDLDEAHEVARALAYDLPRRTYPPLGGASA